MMKKLNDIIGLSAYADGVVEHGRVEVLIDGTVIWFTIQEYSNGCIRIMLDDDTPENRDILKRYGVEFEDEDGSDEIITDEFRSYLREIYSESGTTDHAHWTSHLYDELTKGIDTDIE